MAIGAARPHRAASLGPVVLGPAAQQVVRRGRGAEAGTPRSTLACAAAHESPDRQDRVQRREAASGKESLPARRYRPPVPSGRPDPPPGATTSAATLRTAASACAQQRPGGGQQAGSGPSTSAAQACSPAAITSAVAIGEERRPPARTRDRGALRCGGSLAPVGAASPTGRRRREGGGSARRESDQRARAARRRDACRPRPAREPGRPRRRRARPAVVAACT